MKRLYTALAVALCASAAAAPAYAQVVEETENVTVIVGDRSGASKAEEAFSANKPASSCDPGLPRFAIIGHDHKFYLGIGAQFLGEAVFDWGDRMPSSVDFVPSSITRRTPGNGGDLRFSASTSSIYLNFVALPQSKDKVGLFFAATFDNDYNMEVEHLYAKYRGLTVGYTYSAFIDGAAIPLTIDDQGPNGVACYKTIVAYWVQNFTPHFSGAIGLDAPSRNMTYCPATAEVTQRIPAFPLWLQYGWGDGSHVRASALLRPMQYRNLAKGKNRTPMGWGVQFSGTTGIAGGLSASFSASYGAGIADYLQDDNGLGYDAIPCYEKPGCLKLMKTMGLTGALKYEFSKKWQANAVYSHLTNWLPDGCAATKDMSYRYGDYVAANVIYTINRILEVGLEYDYGHQKTWTGESLHTNRLQCQLAVTF